MFFKKLVIFLKRREYDTRQTNKKTSCRPDVEFPNGTLAIHDNCVGF